MMKKTRVRKKEQMFDIFTSTALVMMHFFKHPTIEFTLSEVAGHTNLSKSTVSKIIDALKRAGFLTIVDLGVVYRIRANLDGTLYKREKTAFNIYTILRSEIGGFLAKKFNNPKCIALFGSFRNGEDQRGSDIDIAVEVPDGEKTGNQRFEEFKQFEEMLERKIVVHVFNRKEVDHNLFHNIVNGVVLYGFLEVSK